jgi:hypothetical protein
VWDASKRTEISSTLSPLDQAVDTRVDQLVKSTPLNAAYYPVIGKIQGLPKVIWTIFLNFGLEFGEPQDGQMKPSMKSVRHANGRSLTDLAYPLAKSVPFRYPPLGQAVSIKV